MKSGDVLAEVETDKATMDLEAFDSGILRKILIQEGAKVPVQSRIGIIGTKDEKIDESAPAAPAAVSAPAAPEAKKEEAKTSAAPTTVAASSAAASGGGRVKASPLAKKVAAEKGVALATLSGSGPGGRIVKKDVLNAPANGHAPRGGGSSIYAAGPIAPEGSTKLTTMRSVIAKRLLESKTTIPPFLSRDRGRREAAAGIARAAQRLARQVETAGQTQPERFRAQGGGRSRAARPRRSTPPSRATRSASFPTCSFPLPWRLRRG